MSDATSASVRDIRARFEEDRAHLVARHHRGDGGGVIVRAFCRLVDATLSTICPFFLDDPDEIAVIATGGYGRGELAFGSDVDLSLVHLGSTPPEGIKRFIQALWDLGWEIGHQVVTPDQAVDLVSGDRETLTAHLEMRTVWGSGEITDGLDEIIRRDVLGPRLEDYLSAKVNELRSRHQLAGDTVYLSEPDVKRGPGGLRDMHTLLWLSNASGGPKDWRSYLADQQMEAVEYSRIQGGYDLTWRVRNSLHLQKGRAWDRLDHRSQSEIAIQEGYTAGEGRLPVERFMRDYYRASWEIFAFTALQLARAGWEPRSGSATSLTMLKPGNGEAAEWPTDELMIRPLSLLDRFITLTRTGSGLGPVTAAFLYRQGERMGGAIRQADEHGRLFMTLLEEPEVAWAMHTMHQLGILGGILPEFARLTALVQFDPYHQYTVDEHSLRMLDALETMLSISDGEKSTRTFSGLKERVAAVMPEIPMGQWHPSRRNAAILRLVFLYHDIGKGSGTGNHSERGARVIRRAGVRLGLEKTELDLAVFLVRHHLLLNTAAQRRDIHDSALLKRMCRLIRSPERLYLLAIVTFTDLAALNPTILTPWKCRLLVDLVENIQRMMAGEELRQVEVREGLEQADIEPDERDRAITFLESMPPEYRRQADVKTLSSDVRLLEKFEKAGDDPGTCVVDIVHGRENSEMTVVARDQERLVSHICGLLAAHDVTILHARIFTRLDGLIFDRFTVADAASELRMTDDQERSILKNLPGVLEGSVDVEKLLEDHRVRWSLRDRQIMDHPVQVHLDPTASDQYTVIDIRARDQVGLLHDVAAVMADFGVSIHQAFITTEGERAVDAFYVTDPLGAPLDAGSCTIVISALRDALTSER
ncbi:[protein-PII] uridylyltransferase [Candidatus Zixiibacteriota bacterium]